MQGPKWSHKLAWKFRPKWMKFYLNQIDVNLPSDNSSRLGKAFKQRLSVLNPGLIVNFALHDDYKVKRIWRVLSIKSEKLSTRMQLDHKGTLIE